MKLNERGLQVVSALDQKRTHVISKLDVVPGLMGETSLFNWKPLDHIESGRLSLGSSLGKTECRLLDRFGFVLP